VRVFQLICVVPQSVTAPLTSAAIFLVVAVNPDLEHHATVRSFCGELAKLVRAVGFRDLDGGLSCIMGFGSDAWDRLFGSDRPAELHTFREIRAGTRHAVATPGDLLLHIRAQRMDLCFELATQIMAQIAGAVSPLDEVHGFRYFDARDLVRTGGVSALHCASALSSMKSTSRNTRVSSEFKSRGRIPGG
jgi:putative iron-dependent peroxidase